MDHSCEWEGGDIMDFKKDVIVAALEKALASKGKRKFKQSVEFIVNFRGIDFNKPENRLNVEVKLPKGRGKENKLVVVGDESALHELKKDFPDLLTFTPKDVEEMDKKKVKLLAKDHLFYAFPKNIAVVAKNWAKILGPRGKSPRPLVGNPKEAIATAKNTARVATRGKNLPTVHTVVGSEDMDASDIAENILAVVETMKKKIATTNIKSAFVKLSMGSPAKVGE
ncbi:MAG: hypothetical protein D6769_02795 [Methanobacteriota archaeon]|nr:MAG: hypothetical protein D6769_02795 [Euryarchaeota archaeon]